MKKRYEFSGASSIFDWAVVIIGTAIFFAIALFVVKDRMFTFGIAVSCAGLLPMMIQHTNREIIVYDDHIDFKSYHLNRKYQDGSINYSQIKRIYKSKDFNLKFWCIKLDTTAYEYPIKIEATIKNYRELFSFICSEAQKNNPDVEIYDDVYEAIKDSTDRN